MELENHDVDTASKQDAILSALNGAEHGLTLAELGDRLPWSGRTIRRHLEKLERRRIVVWDRVNRRKVYRALSKGKDGADTISLIALLFARLLISAFRGTGLAEDFDSLFVKARAGANDETLETIRSLEQKVVFIDRGVQTFEGRDEDFDEAITALLRGVSLLVRHRSVAGGEQRFRLEPYLLLIYRQGLYLIGRSDEHAGIRTFGFDGFVEMTRERGNHFEVPETFDGQSITEGSFGLIGGKHAEVVIRFETGVRRYVERRRWHPSQKIRVREDGDIELALEVDGTAELLSWALSFGRRAEIVEPPFLRREAAAEVAAALARYDD